MAPLYQHESLCLHAPCKLNVIQSNYCAYTSIPIDCQDKCTNEIPYTGYSNQAQLWSGHNNYWHKHTTLFTTHYHLVHTSLCTNTHYFHNYLPSTFSPFPSTTNPLKPISHSCTTHLLHCKDCKHTHSDTYFLLDIILEGFLRLHRSRLMHQLVHILFYDTHRERL
jgi:hypothetical protein